MIRSDHELKTTQARSAHFRTWLNHMHVTTPVKKFLMKSSGYQTETQRMQASVSACISCSPDTHLPALGPPHPTHG